jgi:hypothetical protein
MIYIFIILNTHLYYKRNYYYYKIYIQNYYKITTKLMNNKYHTSYNGLSNNIF